ncbi:MAG: hypothetical protein R3B06_08070 [Kofleriaceae bacterium]
MTLGPDALVVVAQLHVAATLVMVGVIWTIQRVHYPLFAYADRARWDAFHAAHTRRITPVVAPVMSVELATAAALALAWPDGPWLVWPGLALAVLTWGATGLIAVPVHARLAQAHDAALVRRLVATNWVRTAAWTVRAPLALALAVAAG